MRRGLHMFRLSGKARAGVVAVVLGGAVLAPGAALAAGNDGHPSDLQRALRDERRADRAITWGEHHPTRLDQADERALAWERRADRQIEDAGVPDPRLDAGRAELRAAEQ